MPSNKQKEADKQYVRALALDEAEKNPIAAYTRGLALHPVEWAYQNRGWAYFKRGDFANAAADWKQSGKTYLRPLGRALFKIGDVDGAIVAWTKALGGDKNDMTHGYLAEAYAAKGDDAEAARHRKLAGRPEIDVPAWQPPKPKRGESYDAYVARLVAAAPLSAKTRAAIAALREPALFVAAKKQAPAQLGASRLGGLPDLPKGAKWPRAGGKPMSFVAQVKLADVKSKLPKRGTLAFFVDEMGDYLERGAVLHVDGKALARAELPDDFARYVDGEPARVPYTARGVAFTAARKLLSPTNPRAAKIAWGAGEEAAYTALFQETTDDRHQLLGYRDRGYDAEQSATTALLFQLASDGDMEWGDADFLYFYIPAAALAKGDFAKAFTYCGE